MLFEAPGVYDSQHYPTATDRVNRDRLAQFRQYVAHGRKPGSLLALVESDRLFQENQHVAYAESWALAYYLSETQPAQLQRLSGTNRRPGKLRPLRLGPAPADFLAAFGSDVTKLEAGFLRFMEQIRE